MGHVAKTDKASPAVPRLAEAAAQVVPPAARHSYQSALSPLDAEERLNPPVTLSAGRGFSMSRWVLVLGGVLLLGLSGVVAPSEGVAQQVSAEGRFGSRQRPRRPGPSCCEGPREGHLTASSALQQTKQGAYSVDAGRVARRQPGLGLRGGAAARSARGASTRRIHCRSVGLLSRCSRSAPATRRVELPSAGRMGSLLSRSQLDPPVALALASAGWRCIASGCMPRWGGTRPERRDLDRQPTGRHKRDYFVTTAAASPLQRKGRQPKAPITGAFLDGR